MINPTKYIYHYGRKILTPFLFLSNEKASRVYMYLYKGICQKKRSPKWFTKFVLSRLNSNIGKRFIEFELTNICNARCIFCPYPDLLKTNKKFVRMEDATFDKALQSISKMDYSLISFTPTTGDTLLHPNWDEKIVAAIKLETIKQVIFYSNAILLEDAFIDKFIKLLKKDTEHKFFSILFSVGGVDAKTYKEVFQVNKFDLVVSNINRFVARLKKENIKVAIGIKMRAPSHQNITKKEINNLFNTAAYPYFFIDNNKYFEISDHLEKFKEFEYSKNIDDKSKACVYLHKTRFAADGGIWADGCVLSEIKNDASLKLGTVSDKLTTIENNRSQIIENWEKHNKIPKVCEGCTIYTPK